ncbi:MAG: M20/M25/M40 family metallo-hydrolase [Pyrinomonadaceae bacterium]|nr:M20/M25/M40 family metallo-hydrolase [Pyrinomonadaceae bacterium]
MRTNLLRKNILSLALIFAILLPGFAVAQTATKANSAARKSAQTITAQQLKEYLYFVASDAMGGRDTPSDGLDITAEFIALMLKRWGFKPAGDNGTFMQTMAMTSNQVDPSKTALEIGGSKMKFGYHFFAQPTAGAVSNAQMVFAGNGWLIKKKDIDPLKDLDVKGKIVVIHSETDFPEGVTMKDFQEGKLGQFGVDILSPPMYAASKGAAGIIVIANEDVDRRWDLHKAAAGKGRATVDKLVNENRRRGRNLPTVTISREAAEKLFASEEKPMSELAKIQPFAMKSTASLNVATNPVVLKTQNVVAVWEGSDPVLKNEMVAIGAHYDHVGTNPLAKGDDKIWNGADDDGSGTVAVLAIAEALKNASKRPKRSILLVWHAGEEKGLLGSEYFNKFPTVDIKNVVAQLNIDMIGRSRKTDDQDPRNKELSGENTIYVIGSEMMSSKLGEVTKATNDAFLKLEYDYRYDDPKDPNRFFFRSDHFNYALNGIPIVFWFDGVHEDYHQAGDHPDKIDYEKMEKVTRTIYLTMWEIADLKVKPAVDKQLPKELTERR